MEQYQNVVQDLAGNVVPQASIRVLLSDGGANAVIFDANGAQAANPTPCDAEGYFAFQAANGKYFLQVEVAGKVYKKLGPVTLYDAPAPPTDVVQITDYPDLRAAIYALPDSGGVVEIPIGRFRSGLWGYHTTYMGRDNITLRGRKKPNFSLNCDRLEGGSIIEGRFNAFANNFHVENLGFDAGKFVCDRDYPGFDTRSANHPNGEGWDAFAFAQPNTDAPFQPRRGFKARNLIGLNHDSLSYGHAVLIEAVNGGVLEGEVSGMYGIHGSVIKSQNIVGEYFSGYGATSDHVIIKSDSYAVGGNISIDTVEGDVAPPGTTPWSAPPTADFGLFLNPATYDLGSVRIGKLRMKGAKALLRSMGTIPTRNLDNVQIDSFEGDGLGTSSSIGMLFSDAIFNRIRIGKAVITNVNDGIAYKQAVGFSDDALEIGSLTMANVTLRGVQALGFGRIIVGSLRMQNVATGYVIENTARVLVGIENLINVGVKFGLNPPSLTAGWQQIPGFDTFAVTFHNYGVTLQGALSPTGTPSPNVINLPLYLQPSEAILTSASSRNAANVDRSVFVSLGGGNNVLKINDGAGIVGAENFLSLHGISYRVT